MNRIRERLKLTSAGRIMLPTYMLVNTYIGLCYVFSPPQRLQGPSLSVARAVLPMWAWGIAGLVLAAVLLWSRLTDQPGRIVAALCFGAAGYLGWAGFYATAIFVNPEASLVSPIWPLLGAAAHVASAVSIANEEGE